MTAPHRGRLTRPPNLSPSNPKLQAWRRTRRSHAPPTNTSTTPKHCCLLHAPREDRVPTYCKNNPLTTNHIEWSERCCSSWTQAGGCSWLRGVMLRPVKLAVPYSVALNRVGRLFVLCRVR